MKALSGVSETLTLASVSAMLETPIVFACRCTTLTFGTLICTHHYLLDGGLTQQPSVSADSAHLSRAVVSTCCGEG